MNLLEILGKIGFDWRMALANLVNFLIIFWLLKRYAFEPVKKIVSKRQSEVQEGLDNAEKAKTELMQAEENYNQKMQKAQEEVQNILAHAQSKADIVGAEIIKKAESKVEAIVSEARETIKKERVNMERELQAKTVSIAIEVAQKILKSKLDEKTESELIKELSK